MSDMESIIAAALITHRAIVSEQTYATCNCDVTSRDTDHHAAHRARAVLAALESAGNVEWGVLAAGQEKPYTYSTQKAATGDAECTCCTLVFRITGPWERAE